MITNKTQMTNYNALSVVGATNTPVMRMSANLSPNRELTFSSSITDLDLYFANQQEVDNDYEEWKREVIASVEENNND